MTSRESAMATWNALTLEEKFYIVIHWLSSKGLNTTDRHPNSLTGREIEEALNLKLNVV